MPEPLAYLNGQLLPYTHAVLPLHDAGFVMGATVVDYCRTFRRKLYRWPDHLARFRGDAGDCSIPLHQTDDELTAVSKELVEHNAKLLPEGGELGLITFATPGPIGHFVGQPGGFGPSTIGMHTIPLDFGRYRPFFAEGVTLVCPGFQPSDPAALLPPRVKHRSRMHWWLAEQALCRSNAVPGAVALLRDGEGAWTETAVGNLLVVRGGGVISVARSAVLDSISLRVVEELCDQLGIPFAESRLGPGGDPPSEAMLTGTAFCLAGVRSLDGTTLPWPGPVFQRLLAAWSDTVGVGIAHQFYTGR
jgi:branched-chain amino acid aminotransferase